MATSKKAYAGKSRGGPRRSAGDLLEAGLGLLAEGGIEGLTIDALCKRLRVTKGSFYHHFRGRDDFLERMLEHWAREWTDGPMRRADTAEDAVARFRTLVEESHAVPMDRELSIRAWALRNPLARRYLEKVDAIRMEYLRHVFAGLTDDPDRALMLSRVAYAMYVGTGMIAPPIVGRERRELVCWMEKEVYGIPPEGDTQGRR